MQDQQAKKKTLVSLTCFLFAITGFTKSIDSIRVYALPIGQESYFTIEMDAFPKNSYSGATSDKSFSEKVDKLIKGLKKDNHERPFDTRMVCYIYQGGQKKKLAMDRDKKFYFEGIYYKKSRKLYKCLKSILPKGYNRKY